MGIFRRRAFGNKLPKARDSDEVHVPLPHRRGRKPRSVQLQSPRSAISGRVAARRQEKAVTSGRYKSLADDPRMQRVLDARERKEKKRQEEIAAKRKAERIRDAEIAQQQARRNAEVRDQRRIDRIRDPNRRAAAQRKHNRQFR